MNKYLAEEQADDIFEATFPRWIIRLKVGLLGYDIRKTNRKAKLKFFSLWMSVEAIKPQQFAIKTHSSVISTYELFEWLLIFAYIIILIHRLSTMSEMLTCFEWQSHDETWQCVSSYCFAVRLSSAFFSSRGLPKTNMIQ